MMKKVRIIGALLLSAAILILPSCSKKETVSDLGNYLDTHTSSSETSKPFTEMTQNVTVSYSNYKSIGVTYKGITFKLGEKLSDITKHGAKIGYILDKSFDVPVDQVIGNSCPVISTLWARDDLFGFVTPDGTLDPKVRFTVAWVKHISTPSDKKDDDLSVPTSDVIIESITAGIDINDSDEISGNKEIPTFSNGMKIGVSQSNFDAHVKVTGFGESTDGRYIEPGQTSELYQALFATTWNENTKEITAISLTDKYGIPA